MTHLNLTGVILSLLMIVPMPASAGSWSTQAVLASNAYSGTIALDANGNMVSVWYQNALPNGTAVNEIWASTAPFGHAWSTPVDISGNIGVASGNPSVRSSAAGNSTAIYTSPTLGAAFVDHPAGGNWGTPGSTGGVNQFYVSNDRGDEGLAYGGGGPRGAATPVSVVQRPAGGSWTTPTTIATGTFVALDGSVVAPDGTMAVAGESYTSVCGRAPAKRVTGFFTFPRMLPVDRAGLTPARCSDPTALVTSANLLPTIWAIWGSSPSRVQTLYRSSAMALPGTRRLSWSHRCLHFSFTPRRAVTIASSPATPPATRRP